MSTSVNYFFWPKFPNISEKFVRRKRVAIPKRFALQANAIKVKYFMFYDVQQDYLFKRRCKFGYYLRFSSFCFFKEKPLDLKLSFIIRKFKIFVVQQPLYQFRSENVDTFRQLHFHNLMIKEFLRAVIKRINYQKTYRHQEYQTYEYYEQTDEYHEYTDKLIDKYYKLIDKYYKWTNESTASGQTSITSGQSECCE